MIKLYIVETGTKMYERFQNHLSAIRRVTEDPVSVHFNKYLHSIKDLEIVGIEKIRQKDIHYRKIRESFWIDKLQTTCRGGINQNKGIGDGVRGVV